MQKFVCQYCIITLFSCVRAIAKNRYLHFAIQYKQLNKEPRVTMFRLFFSFRYSRTWRGESPCLDSFSRDQCWHFSTDGEFTVLCNVHIRLCFFYCNIILVLDFCCILFTRGEAGRKGNQYTLWASLDFGQKTWSWRRWGGRARE